jgi:hypothetical protein
MSHQKLNFKSKLNTECLRYLQGCGQSLCVAPKYKAFLKDDTGWSLGGICPPWVGPALPTPRWVAAACRRTLWELVLLETMKQL